MLSQLREVLLGRATTRAGWLFQCASGMASLGMQDRARCSPHTAEEHAQLREESILSRSLLRARGRSEVSLFKPSPSSQLSHDRALGFSFSFKDKINVPTLVDSIRDGLLPELPVLAGRVRLQRGGWSFADVLVETSNQGVEFIEAEASEARITDVQPWHWPGPMRGRTLDDFPVPYYTEPIDVEKMLQGKEALTKFRLTHCPGGCILSLSIAHLLTDAGRVVNLMQRLSEHYRARAQGAPLPPPGLRLSPDSALLTVEGLAAAMEAPPAEGPRKALDHHLSLGQMLRLPREVYGHVTTRHDVHAVYLPPTALPRLKAAAQSGVPGSNEISTMDAVQALVALLLNSLRGRPLVPVAPGLVTTNVDVLHPGLRLRDPGAAAAYFGNAVALRQIPGVGAQAEAPRGTEDLTPEAMRSALQRNALLIRDSLKDARSGPAAALEAVWEQEQMVALPKAWLLANFLAKGANKCSSTTSITRFDFGKIDFGSGPPQAFQMVCHPWFDWWTMIQPVVGTGGGIVCSLVMETGLGQALQAHPAWEELAPEAWVIPAGEGPPRELAELGGDAGAQAHWPSKKAARDVASDAATVRFRSRVVTDKKQQDAPHPHSAGVWASLAAALTAWWLGWLWYFD